MKTGAAVTRFVAVLAATAGLGYGVAVFTAGPASTAAADTTPAQHAPVAPAVAQPAPVPAAQQVLPADDPLTPAPEPALLAPGASGRQVRIVQARLRQLGWYAGKVNGYYRSRTTQAVERFQGRHRLVVTGSIDSTTLERLRALTRRPTRDELANRTIFDGQGGGGTWTTKPVDARCRVGHVLCVDKSSRTIRWVVNGEVHKTMAVRFGAAYTPTREGVFHIGWKSRDHVSTLFHTSMPFAMFFSGGQAVHYSSDFAARGYSGASHGCVNVRDYAGIRWLFDRVKVGDKVVISWS